MIIEVKLNTYQLRAIESGITLYRQVMRLRGMEPSQDLIDGHNILKAKLATVPPNMLRRPK